MDDRSAHAWPLSDGQRAIFVDQQLHPEGSAYHVPIAVHLRPGVDVCALRRSLARLVRRHSILRSTIVDDADGPSQRVHDAPDEPSELVDARGWSDEAVTRAMELELHRPFALEREHPLRLRVYDGGTRGAWLLLVAHHIAVDLASVQVLVSEILDGYSRFDEDDARDAVSFGDLVETQRTWLVSNAGVADARWWDERLRDASPELPLGSGGDPGAKPGDGRRLDRALSGELMASIDRLARACGATRYETLLGAWCATLYRATGRADIIVGTPTAVRWGRRYLDLVGYAVSPSLVRVQGYSGWGLRRWIETASASARATRSHARVPLPRQAASLARRPGVAAWQVGFTFQRAHRRPELGPFVAGVAADPVVFVPGLVASPWPVEHRAAQTLLELVVVDLGASAHATWVYDATRLSRPDVAALVDRWIALLTEGCAAPERAVDDLDIGAVPPRAWWSPGEARKVAPTLAALAEQVARAPDATALDGESARWSYAALWSWSARVAHFTRNRGIAPEARVAIVARRPEARVAALLGLWRAGAVAVPLDPEHPQGRIDSLCAEASVALVLDDAAIDGAATPDPTEIVDAPFDEDRGAYVIFTSGSTGRPRPVLVSHGALARHAAAISDAYGLSAADRVLQFHGATFDVSFEELVPTLLCGASAVLRPETSPAPGRSLHALIAARGVTVLNLPASYWHAWVDEIERVSEPPPSSLRLVVTGNERVRGDLLARWLLRCPEVAWRSAYGPTEATITATVYAPRDGEPAGETVSLGRPLPGVRAYVLDRAMRMVPTGVAGELFLGGASLARGYLGQADVTADRFVPDPFADAPGARMYRTGDRARWSASGELDFLGRADHQVKLRGHRVELGEVERTLAEHPSVRECVVRARDLPDGTRGLAAWLSLTDATTTDEVRAWLEARLPGYMIPTVWIALDRLPRTAGGKVDANALPAPASTRDVTAPATDTERVVAELWTGLLGVTAPGRDEDFFALGGHSLAAMQLVARVRERLGVELPLRDVFAHPTLRDLAARVDALSLAPPSSMPPLRAYARGAESPASFAQERLWFLDRLDPGNAAYHMPLLLRLRGALDVEALRGAFGVVVTRHEALRTVFVESDTGATQLVVDTLRADLVVEDISLRGDAEPFALRSAERAAMAPFDLTRGPLVRLNILRVGDDDHVLAFVMHHIVSDEVSMVVLLRELGAAYRALRAGETPTLPVLPVQYADYARWQREWMTGELLASQLAWWRERLEGLEPLELPTDRPRPAARRFRGGVVYGQLAAPALASLEAIARSERATLFMTLLAGFSLTLSRWSGQSDVAVGSPVAGRSHAAIEGLIGFFVNTLVLRADLSGAASFRELLRRTRESCLDAFAHQEIPFEKVVEAVNPPRDPGVTPLFQVMFALQGDGSDARAAVTLEGLESSLIEGDRGSAKFDLTVDAWEADGGLSLSFDFDRDLWDDATVARMASHYVTLLEGVARSPDALAAAIPMFDEAERHDLLVAWNNTAQHVPEAATLHGLVATQARRTPNAEALRYDGRSLTYEMLERAAGTLSARLRACGARPESRVAVMAERSFAMVIGMLGVLKSGAAYVPVDPDHPADRVAFTLQDAGVSLLVTTADLAQRAPAGVEVVIADERSTDGDGVAVEVAPEHLAYVIYTSGSTGRPKGVMITHGNIAHHLQWRQGAFPIGPGERFLQKAAFTFDISLWEIFGPLIAGGTVVLAPPGAQADPTLLVELMARESVTLAILQPTILAAVLDEPELARCTALRRVFCGGEALTPELRSRLFARVAGVALHHLYGPTETTVDVTHHACAPGERRQPVPIGRPIGNTRAYVLDATLRPVPVGIPGELFIAGRGVARGYLGRPDLTAERFVPDPFSPTPGLRMYRTGDRVRWLSDGVLEFLGRIGTQVKLRGYRVELGEVEAALRDNDSVRDAVALVREDRPGDRRLVAYVTSATARETLDSQALRAQLSSRLPAYMVPSAIVALDALPLTSHGKIDRRALPAPDATGEGDRYEAPRNATEQALAEVWASVLKLPRVGVHDDFFALGGHSLLATQVASRVRAVLGVELPLRVLFEATTVAEQAPRVEALRGSSALPPIEACTGDRAVVPASFAQVRLWFLEELEPGTSAYLVPVVLRVRGPLDVGAFRGALQAVVDRHAALRTVFEAGDDGPLQRVLPSLTIELPVDDLDGDADARESHALVEAQREVLRPFDLARGPLIRARLLALGADDHLLLLVMHHIVSDAWSAGVLMQDVATAYERIRDGRDASLPPLPVQYTDYALWQRAWLRGNALEAQLGYWRTQLAGLEAIDLPTDRPRPQAPTNRGAVVHHRVGAAVISSLNALSRAEGATLFMALLAGFSLVLSRWSGRDDVAVGSPIAGRNHAATEGLIGFFVNTLVLRADLSEKPSFRELLRRVREVCLGAYAHQDVPFEKVVEALNPPRDRGVTPLFQVMFALQNAPAPSFGSDELRFEPVTLDESVAKFDLSVEAWEHGGGVELALEYSRDLFDERTIARMAGHLETLLGAAVASPDAPVARLEMLTDRERHQVLTEWNATATDRPRDVLVHDLVALQAERTPDAVAVTGDDATLTYGQLIARADTLAGRLRVMGVGPEVRVAVCADRTAAAVVALLGVLRAGGVYVPLDPDHPGERRAMLLEDCDASVLLTHARFSDSLPSHKARVLLLDVDDGRASSTAERPALSPANAAYVIYTSGSTGRPKGVVVTHGSLGSLVSSTQQRFGFTSGDVVPCLASLAFDISLFEIFAALAWGGTSQMITRDQVIDLDGLASRLESATVLHAVPALMTALVARVRERGLQPRYDRVRMLFVGGDAVPAELPTAMREAFPNGRIDVLYGPTEATILASSDHADPTRARRGHALGRPLPDVTTYVLDRNLQPVPIGVAGELFLGGAGVARGYLDRPDLTAERFVPDPFSARPGARFYRTGDRAQWRGDGTLEFLGRGDRQVKIRGYRIELGEIDAALSSHPSVRACVVVAREDMNRDKRLVAYVVGDASASTLRDHLGATLPAYMVPTTFVALDALPLTPNGKVDRRALPAPEGAEGTLGAVPRTPIEALLCGIFAEVLGVERVGVDDDFFALGGHSLAAMRVVARASTALGADVPLRAMFEAPTPATLARAVGASRALAAAPPLAKVSRAEPLPASFAQQRLWFLDRLAPGGATYVIPIGARITGPLDEAALARSLREVVQRHEVLRTTFMEVDGEAVQVIAADATIEVIIVDLTELHMEQREAELRRLTVAEVTRPFDLAHGPLLRASLVRLSADERVLLLALHHAVFDGWSVGVMLRELTTLYAGSTLPALPIQYADWSAWQRSWLRGDALNAQIAYWRKRLAGVEALELPTDRPRPAVQSFRGATRAFELPGELRDGLVSLARREGATLFMALLAAFQALLGRHAGSDDVAVGTPIAGRTRPEVEPLIGLFVNTLALRVDLGGDPTFRALLARVREACLGAYAHQDVPFERVVEALAPARDLGRSPLVQVMFALQNVSLPELALGDAVLSPIEFDGETARFDLSVSVDETPGGLTASFEYATDLFDAETIDRMASRFRVLLTAATATPDARLSSLPWMDASERDDVLFAWNATASDRPRDVLVHDLVALQAERTPDAVAVVGDDATLTYGQLIARADTLAGRLRVMGVGPEVRVAVCADRSAAAVVALLGVLRAGGVYVPLDPDHPAERRAMLLEDCGASVLLTHARLSDSLPSHKARVLLLDVNDSVPFSLAERPTLTPTHAAYVIYTSGSTGHPKGVVVTHESLAALVTGTQQRFGFVAGDVVPCLASLAFDISLFEIFAALAWGGTSQMITRDQVIDLDGLASRLESATVLHAVPALMTALVARVRERGLQPRYDRVRMLFVGGDAVPAELPTAMREAFPNGRIDVLYGPTEATILASSDHADPTRARRGHALGRPLPDVTTYVLDRNLQPVPVGVAGELFLGGAGVARGYLDRPDLTAERFVPDPFSAPPGARFYRTGDRARWRENGTLEFLGRGDGQVKIRGYRIELGEIEAALRMHPGVRDAVVMARPGATGDPRLVAYVVTPDEAPSHDELRAFVGSRLPAYMVPSAVVALAALPLTPTGKIDRKALPSPEGVTAGAVYTAPRTPIEALMCGIFAEVLGVERVGVDDDFFASGGHSLAATRVIARVRAASGADVPLRAMFESPTPAALARAVESSPPLDAAPPLTAVSRVGPLPASFAQQRLWFLDRLAPGGATYVIPIGARITGPLNEAALARSLREVVQRHEALRTTFAEVDGEPVQVIAADARFDLTVVDLTRLPRAERELEALRLAAVESTRPFDLARGPLVRASLVRIGLDEHALLLALHHAVSDGWSIGVLLRELAARYVGSTLPALPMQYADWSAWQRTWLQGDALAAQVAYWRTQLAGVEPLELPTDRPRPAVQSFRGAMHVVSLSGALRDGLTALARSEGATLFMALLAVFQALLGHHAGRDDVTVGTPVAGRTRPEVEPLIGLFVNTLALRVDLGGDPSFRALLGRVRASCVGAFAHQDVPFEKVVEALAPARDLSRSPLVQVMFALQNAPLPKLALGEAALSPIEFEGDVARFDLSVSLHETTGGLSGSFEYATDLFDAATIDRLATQFSALLAAVVTTPDAPLSSLPWTDTVGRPKWLSALRAATIGDPRIALPGEPSAEVGRVPPRDALERLVADAWEALLGLRIVSVRDDFFALGGHSLLVARLASEIRARTGHTLPLAALFQHRTVEAQCALLRGETTPTSLRVTLQHGAGAAFFCVHAIGGTVHRFAPLARSFGAAWSFHGLQAQGLDGASEPLDRINVMAARYLDEVRRTQPEGPYHLGGWSMGGIIALEMARQLAADGHEVASLALLDAFPLVGEHALHDDEAPPDEALARVHAAHVRALRTWRPLPYAGRATVFSAEGSRCESAEAHRALWSPFIAEVAAVTVPGDHESMFAEPHVAALASALVRSLT